MPPIEKTLQVRIAAAALVVFAGLLWVPALGTPFWGDDYFLLQTANTANSAGVPWWGTFWPNEPLKFWRPLSQESYWRFIDSLLAGNPRQAHLVNLGLLVISSLGVGLLGHALARICEWARPGAVGLLTSLVYLNLALHLLPVHWVSAANSSILVILTALCLLSWLMIPSAGRLLRPLLATAVIVLLCAALLSKESAALTPLLMGILSLFVWPKIRLDKTKLFVWIAGCVLVAVWMLLRSKFTVEADPEYELVFGANLLRNGVSLIAWMLNVPREALRMIVTGDVAVGALWAACSALPMLIVWIIAVRPLIRELNPRQAAAAVAFVLAAYAPYFLFNWNSYAYYAAISAMLPMILLAHGLLRSRSLLPAVILIGVSSLTAVQGTRMLDHPGLIGRAHWAEKTLTELERQDITGPLFVKAADKQRFYAMGAAGLAWRLDIPPKDVITVDRCPSGDDPCLVIESDGNYFFQSTE